VHHSQAMSATDSSPLPEYLRVSIGSAVRAWRVARQLTLEELAGKAGGRVTRGYLSQLENNKIHSPGEAKIAQVARALDIDPIVLVTRQFPSEHLIASVDTDRAVDGLQGAQHAAPEHSVTADLSPLLTALAHLSQPQQQVWIDALAALLEKVAVAVHSRPDSKGG